MATTLQSQFGLPQYTAVEPWLFEHPDRIRAVHTAFAEAGSDILLTATFGALPDVRADWRDALERAVALARACGRRVWLSLGSGGAGHAEAVAAAPTVDGVILETFTDARGVHTVREVRAVWEGPLVLSVVPDATGAPLGGGDMAELARATLTAGATGFGLNCAPPKAVLAAIDRIDPDIPLWAKPNGDLGAATAPLLKRCRWLGGCCGTSPDHIRALRSSWRSAG